MQNGLQDKFRIMAFIQDRISHSGMCSHILQLLDGQRIRLSAVEIFGDLKLSDIMDHSRHCHLVAGFRRQSHFARYLKSQIAHAHTMCQLRGQVQP